MKKNIFETILNVQQSYRAEEIKAKNEALIRNAINHNKEIQKLQKHLNQSNVLSRQILENQLKEIELRETQKYYKELAFKNYEILNKISSLQDLNSKSFLIRNFIYLLYNNFTIAKSALNELNDKEFCLKALDTISKLEKTVADYLDSYKKSNLYHLEQAQNNYNELLLEYDSIEKSEPKDQYVNSKIRISRWVTSFLLCYLILNFIQILLLVIACSIALIVLIYQEINWLKSYSSYSSDLRLKNANIKKEQLSWKQRISKLEEQLETHIFFELDKKAEQSNPELVEIINSIKSQNSGD